MWRKWADEMIARHGYPWDPQEWDRARSRAAQAASAEAWAKLGYVKVGGDWVHKDRACRTPS